MSERQTPTFDALLERLEDLHEAIGKHFLALHSVVPWTHVILNDDGELMTVDELMDGDVVVFDRNGDGAT